MKKLKFPKISEKMKRRFLAGAFAVMTIFVSVMAYLTSTERTTNRFTIGDIKIDLVEPSFPGNADPDNVPTNHRTLDNNGSFAYSNGGWKRLDTEPTETELINNAKYVTNNGTRITTTKPNNLTGSNDEPLTLLGIRIYSDQEQWCAKNGDNNYYTYVEGNEWTPSDSDPTTVSPYWTIDELSEVPTTAQSFKVEGDNVTFYKTVTGAADTDISYADANYILPGELIPKDPKIVNTGKNEAIVFMKVEVPTYTDVTGVTREVFAFNLTGESIENGNYATNPVLTKFSELTANQVINENWIYLGKADDANLDTNVNGNAQNDLHTYIFGYKTILNPEAPNEKINDGVNKITGADHTPTDYETTNLFKYVVLNPDLNGVDPYEGNKFYQVTTDSTSGQITKAEPVLQDIKIHAYGVQANFLRDNGNDITTGNNMSKDTLTKIWTVAGFGNIVNDTIPPADGHNKYGIPNDQRDENYTNPKNPWTNANGERIVDTSKSVETLTVTYHYGVSETASVTYKRLTGATDWIGGFEFVPNTASLSYYKSLDMTEANKIENLDTYVNSLPAGTADIWVSGDDVTSITGSVVSVTTKTVKFTKGGAEYSLEFTNLKLGDSNNYELTKGSGLPQADDGKHWAVSGDGTSNITNLEGLQSYLNGLDDSTTTVTLVQVDG